MSFASNAVEPGNSDVEALIQAIRSVTAVSISGTFQNIENSKIVVEEPLLRYIGTISDRAEFLPLLNLLKLSAQQSQVLPDSLQDKQISTLLFVKLEILGEGAESLVFKIYDYNAIAIGKGPLRELPHQNLNLSVLRLIEKSKSLKKLPYE